MRTRRTRRIGRTEADRLVAGNPPGPDHRGLAVLLDAATAPPSVEELAGETAAVARYVAAFRATAAEPSATNRVRVSRPAKMIATKVAVGVAFLAAGGTAVAAETGNLPAGVQHFFSALGVPAPDGGPQPTATGAGPAPSRGSASSTPAPTPAPSRSGATTRPAETTALDLCRAWDDTRETPGKPMPAASRRALAAAAGGEKQIDGFCASQLATSAFPTTGQPGTGTGSTGAGSTGNNGDDNGNGDENDNGNGNAGGNGNGQGKGHPSPSPTQRNSHGS